MSTEPVLTQPHSPEPPFRAQDLIGAPRSFTTARTRLEAPSLAQVPVRMAWAQASGPMLGFVPWWRRSVDEAVAIRSAQSEMDKVALGEDVIYNVYELETGAFVGRIDLHTWDFETPRCEIGYMADARTQGRGLLREAVRACIDLAFQLGAVRVEAITDTRNLASIRFAQAVGMQTEGVMRNYERDAAGQLCSQVLLAVLRP